MFLENCIDSTSYILIILSKTLQYAFQLGTIWMFHKAIDLAHPGDGVVIAAGGFCERAIFGELMATYCKFHGLAGIVVDGCIRDYNALSQMDFPIYARGVTPNDPYKNGSGEIGCDL